MLYTPDYTQDGQARSPCQTTKAAVPLHVLRSRGVAISALSARQFQHRRSHSSSDSAGQERPPPQSPRLLGTSSHQLRFSPCLGSGQLGDETLCLVRPSASATARTTRACPPVDWPTQGTCWLSFAALLLTPPRRDQLPSSWRCRRLAMH